MKSVVNRYWKWVFLLVIALPILLFGQDYRNARNEAQILMNQYQQRLKGELSKPYAKVDRGVGIMDRGELSNVTSNFGVVSSFHLFAPAMHWPSWANFRHQYCFGLELLVGVHGDVVTSISDISSVAENYDWEAKDGSLGNLFSGNVTASDGTPILASSDNQETWPMGSDGQPFWPGPFRLNPETGQQVPGEFVSERDIYSEYTDQNNLNGPYGLEVHQVSYSFSRSYARDFLIFDFRIINTSDSTLDSVYVGYMTDFKVDFDSHDHLRFVSLEKGSPRNLVYLWDADPNEGNWDITGYIGFLMLTTPRNKGITDFHYFDNIYEPNTNEQIWEIMSSDTSGRHITVSNFFHGSNRRIDDDALADDMDPTGQKLGTDFVFIVSTGPLTMQPHDTLRSAFAVVLGENETEMRANAEMVLHMAENSYLGPNAPRPPILQASAGNGRVTLTWDGTPSETSRDLLSGLMDFEGYRLYRSEDFGQSWGTPITDEKGNLIGYVPIAQFDLNNNVSGRDPNSNFFLGSNTGIRHTFVDSTVYNGKEYWYAITAYDRGDPTTGVPALESPMGQTPEEVNVVSVIPSALATDLETPMIPQGDSLPPLGGPCDSRLAVQIIDPSQLTGHTYRVTFNDAGYQFVADDEGNPDTLITTTLNLIDVTTGDTLLFNQPLLNETGDNIPVTDGFRVLAQDAEPEVTFIGWTKVQGDTCTFEWRAHRWENFANHPWAGPEAIYTSDDIRLTVDYSGGSYLTWFDMYYDEVLADTVHPWIPLRVEVINDPNHPIDISSTSYLGEYEIQADPSWHNAHYSPLGWDLEPGGKGYNPNTPLWAYLWPDVLIPEREIYDPRTGYTRHVGLFILTQNYPEQYLNQYAQLVQRTPVKPQQGDEFTIRTRKLFRSEVYYEFTVPEPTARRRKADLNQIKVVPNPYIVRAGWERSQFEGRIQFTHLPGECDIEIYTTAGDHVITLHHNGLYDYEFWNLQNKAGVNVAYGLYLFRVKTPEGDEYTGKFVIIR